MELSNEQQIVFDKYIEGNNKIENLMKFFLNLVFIEFDLQ